MNLPKSERTLFNIQRLIFWYIQDAQARERLIKIRIKFDAEAERFNKEEKPRYFCYTMPKSYIVRSSVELENIPERNRTAIILHEIGHIALKAFGNDEAEVKVDAFCRSIPGSGYKMIDRLTYLNANGEWKTARAVETVSKKFLENLGLGK